MMVVPPHPPPHPPHHSRRVIVLKLGGSLLTNKSTGCGGGGGGGGDDDMLLVDFGTLTLLCQSVKTILDTQYHPHVVLIHGAGSFGHIKARKYRLNLGLIPADPEQQNAQRNAVREVRKDMLTLNAHIMQALANSNVDAQSYAPHSWAKGTGPNFKGELPYSKGECTVTHGDVVDVPDEREFGILSGDDLFVRYATESQGVTAAVFATDVDGVLKVPPERATADDLLETWSSRDNEAAELSHDEKIDVTGGIGYKAASGALVAAAGVRVLIVNGHHADRVVAACNGVDSVRGTRILP